MCVSFPVVDVAVLTTGSLSLKEFQINRTPLHERRKESPTPELALVRRVVFEKTEMKYDSTGMFHWVPAQAIEDCTMVSLTKGLTTQPSPMVEFQDDAPNNK